MEVDRRDFLKRTALVAVGGSVVGLDPERAGAWGAGPASDDAMGVLVDLTKCNGCRQCEAACQRANGFDVPTPEELKDAAVFNERRLPGPSCYTTVNRFLARSGEGEERAIYVKANCLHCIDPACVSACIVGALQKEPGGAVTYDPWKCMGCRYCMVACPFQIPAYEYNNVLTPQVRKCTLCQNEGNPNKGGVPACVQACPKECLTYGKRSELLARAHQRIAAHPDTYIDHVYGEHEAGGTTWLYLSGVPFEEIGFLKVDPEAPPRLTEAIQHGVFNYFVPPVAWCGLLGLAMLMTRPEPKPPPAASAAGEPEQQTETATPRPEPIPQAKEHADDGPERTRAA